MTRDGSAAAGARILVVDDEPDLRTLYELTLLREGHEVLTAGTVAEAQAQLQADRFDVLITDMRLPDGDGLQLLRGLAETQRGERGIMITAYGSAENAVEALKCGAFDYLTKPVDLKQFRAVVRSALQAPATTAAPTSPVSVPPEPDAPPAARPSEAVGDAGEAALARMVGTSAVMQAVKRRIVKVARSMAPILVHGESGTGKELAAQAIHACSHRADGPFVPVNCGAIPENLLEAEFFGARKGSYTGATQDRAGFFQAASGGTLFLDEIGDLPLSMQAKLLRAIQERRVRPLGATQEEPVDARIVSATHKGLAAEVQAGRFRQDLYYRLNVIEIALPALRERREDIPEICRVLLTRIAAESGAAPIDLSAEQLTDLTHAPLPGNVRELENLLHRVVALGGSRDSTFGDLMPAASPPAPPMPAVAQVAAALPPLAVPVEMVAPAAPIAPARAELQAWLDQHERAILAGILHDAAGNVAAAAARLGMSARQLGYRLVRLRITPAASGQGGHDPNR